MFKNIGKNFANFFKNVKSKGGSFISTQSSEEFILARNDFGIIGAETSAIQKVINRSASSVRGISDASATVDKVAENLPLKIHFTLELEQNFSVNDVSKDLVSVVRRDLENFFAIIDVEIYVRVTDISRPPKPKKRVR